MCVQFAEVADAIIADEEVNKMVNVVVKRGATAEGRNIYMFVVKPYCEFLKRKTLRPELFFFLETITNQP